MHETDRGHRPRRCAAPTTGKRSFPFVFGVSVHALAIATLYGASAKWPTFNVKDYGALADGRTDDVVAIQRAVDAAGAAGGGVVLIPASDQPYLVTRTIKVTHSNIELRGKGAALKLADNAVRGSRSHVLHITGHSQQKIEGVTIRGLTIDANFWNQAGAVEKKWRPRGLVAMHVRRLLIEDVHVRRAWVSLAFQSGSEQCEARDCTVSQWHNDGFDASGCQSIRLVRCRAYDAYGERRGGPPGSRDAAWELEDGVQTVTLTDCVVEQTDAAGFKLRSHNTTTVNRNVQFIRCRSETGWTILGRDWDTRTEGVILRDCETPAGLTIANGADQVEVIRGKFGGATIMWPRRVCLRNAQIEEVDVIAQERSDGKGTYRPEVVIENVKMRAAPFVAGDGGMVQVDESTRSKFSKDPEVYFRRENFWSEDRFRKRAHQVENVRFVLPKGKLIGRLEGIPGADGFVIWKVQRDVPITKCSFAASTVLPFVPTREMVYSLSLDAGKSWVEIARRRAKSAASRDRWGGIWRDMTDHVKGMKEFLLKATFKNGGGILRHVSIDARTE